MTDLANRLFLRGPQPRHARLPQKALPPRDAAGARPAWRGLGLWLVLVSCLIAGYLAAGPLLLEP